MDANSGEPWSEMDIQDLRASLDFGNTYADAASMLCRDEDEVRQKAKELGLVEHRKKWLPRPVVHWRSRRTLRSVPLVELPMHKLNGIISKSVLPNAPKSSHNRLTGMAGL